MSAPSVVYRAPPGRRARGSVRDDAPTSLDRSSSRSNERVARARSPAASSHGRARGRVVRRGEDSLEPRAGISAPRVRSSRRGGARLARGGSIRHVLFFRRVKSSRERSIANHARRAHSRRRRDGDVAAVDRARHAADVGRRARARGDGRIQRRRRRARPARPPRARVASTFVHRSIFPRPAA